MICPASEPLRRLGTVMPLLTQIILFPHFGLAVSLGENLAIGALFTVASIARS